MSELDLSTTSNPAAIRADERMPKHLGGTIQSLHEGRLLTGQFRQLYSLGDQGRSGIVVHVLLDESELHRDLYGLCEHLADGMHLAEIQLTPDVEVSLSFADGSAGAALAQTPRTKMLTL
ncbi:hypothetical protein [Pseudoclavibacter sp. VKM Ac-2867]|uniref:hypothetical protein n=1 Tax=Pseudoclavibacter sp. VKM Ac-2867 TaxID=2783829 RepID=UPI00188B3AE2|nr:hypothetical protein [Pseudoclavibacter sp. VKM Ac-2867]MBF4460513.1 hypothetical protein [Pseudoclavibacter sp. VKM Ac-2867]